MNNLMTQNEEMIAKSEIDTMILTAKAYPRNITKVLEEAIELATISEDVAASCIYAVPRKDKDGNKVEIKGESIRLAEIMVCCWGNIHAATRISEVSEKYITTEGVCWDLEKNVKITMPDKINIWFGEKNGKGGYRANSDMQTMLSKASCAKALRNAIFKVIPKTFVQTVYQKAVEKAVGDSKTITSKITKVVEKLIKMGLDKEKILEYFGHSNFNNFTQDDLKSLIGVGTALKEGMIKPEEVFSSQKNEIESASDKLNDLIQSKKNPKIENYTPASYIPPTTWDKIPHNVNLETGEVNDDLPY
jgi:hypothetical protein